MVPADLRRRLARFDRDRRTSVRPEGRPRLTAEERMARLLESLPPGAEPRGSGAAAYLRIETELDPASRPGSPSAWVDQEVWHRLQGGAAPAGEHWLILDTETTGLQSGAGTLVFLVGVFRWSPKRARFIQFLLPEPAAEERMLTELWKELERADALVTFNGASFDLPRLRSRAVLCGLKPEVLTRPHLDLVHPARRIATRWLQDCRLQRLERHWLGISRKDDLGGSEVPAAYRRWLGEGDRAGLLRVLRHNREDVQNLLALTGFLSQVYRDGADPFELPPVSLLSLGRLLVARQRPAAARRRLASAARNGRGVTARKAVRELVILDKRSGQWPRAEEELRRAVRRWPRWIWARVELAKILEHRRRDISAALRSVEISRQILDRDASPTDGGSRKHWIAELEHRGRRLQRRQARDRRPERPMG